MKPIRTFLVVGKTKAREKSMTQTLVNAGFLEHKTHPDVVVSYGGDGTFLVAERQFPGIPKLLVRDSKVCVKCNNAGLPAILERLKKGTFFLEKHKKLLVKARDQELLAVNDVVVRNTHPTHALRFLLRKNGELVPETFIGDGVIIATSFGATGYYYSVTKKAFNKGYAVAFNNTTKKFKPVSFKDTDVIEVELLRNHATVAVDNNPGVVYANAPSTIYVSVVPYEANIITLKKPKRL